MIQQFKLNEGIFFEDSGQMLRWGEKIDSFKSIDSPETSSSGQTLVWKNKTCLGGQKLSIQISQDSYQNNDGRFQFADFSEEQEKANESAKKYSKFFKTVFGNPTEYSKDDWGHWTELWNLDDLQIIIGTADRFGTYLIFGIHKGKKFWSLKS